MGEFVRSASSTLEAPVVRRLREKLAGGNDSAGKRSTGVRHRSRAPRSRAGRHPFLVPAQAVGARTGRQVAPTAPRSGRGPEARARRGTFDGRRRRARTTSRARRASRRPAKRRPPRRRQCGGHGRRAPRVRERPTREPARHRAQPPGQTVVPTATAPRAAHRALQRRPARHRLGPPDPRTATRPASAGPRPAVRAVRLGQWHAAAPSRAARPSPRPSRPVPARSGQARSGQPGGRSPRPQDTAVPVRARPQLPVGSVRPRQRSVPGRSALAARFERRPSGCRAGPAAEPQRRTASR